MTIPLPIETERLRIRAFECGDLDEMSAVYGDADVMRHIYLGVLEYALEAANACIDAAFVHLPHRRSVAKIEPGNVDGRPHFLLALERP